jgi:NADPH:quinone reductase-like Zn-dependent oxidoreductase
MLAAVCSHYGPPDVVRIQEIPTPKPAPREVLIRIRTTTVSSGDARLRGLDVPKGLGLATRLAMGWKRPGSGVLGTELCGDIVEIGTAVTRFQVGDAVVAFPGVRMGCHAEYHALPEDAQIVPHPKGLSDEEAAALCFGGTTARYFLQRAGLRPQERVLVVGASGAVGSAAVQLARHEGAHVTAVARGVHHPLLRQLGAHEMIDYQETPLAGLADRYDVIVDTANVWSFAQALPILCDGGRLLMVAAEPLGMLGALRRGPRGQRGIFGMAPEQMEDVAALADLAAAGHYRPVVGTVLPLAEITKAHAIAQSRQKVGSLVIHVTD